MGYRTLRAESPKAPVFPVARTANRTNLDANFKAVPRLVKLSPEVAALLAPPIVEVLTDMPEIPFTMGLKAGDPALDSDPFFLRSQSWSQAEITTEPGDADQDHIAFRQKGNSLDIALKGTSRVFRLQAPLRPLSTDDQWIYLAAQSEDLFQAKSPDEPAGEGIFLISITELFAAKKAQDRVPVFFFPLPGGNWTGNVDVDTVGFTDTVMMTDAEGDTLPISESDIEKVVFAEKINLLLSLGSAARSKALVADDTLATLPLPGSTAGFGMLFTGLNLKHPELNLFTGPSLTSMLPFIDKAFAFVFGATAYAEDSPDQKLVKNLIRVGAIVGLSLIAAVVLRYTVYRERFGKKNGAEPARGLWGRLTQEVRNTGDVFAHNLTFLATIPGNWLGNSVEYIVDRYFTKLGAGKNTLLRRFLNQTVYQARDMTENIPVNWRTAALGIGPMGFTDTALVALQVYFVVPWMVEGIAGAFPSMQEKLNAAFDLNNPDVETFNRNETARNLAAYTSQGASMVSADLKAQLITVLGPEVDSELRKLGLDPHSAEVKTVRDKKFEELFALVAKQVGLPGKEDFLFDASTIWSMGHQLLGNKLTGSVPGLALGSGFLAEHRPGAIVPALNAALKEAKGRLKNDPGDRSLVSAVAILEEVVADLSVTSNFVKLPMKWVWGKLTGKSPPGVADLLSRMRRARQTLVALTYDGPVSEGLKFIPGAWGEKYKEPGCQVAGQIFRRAFSGTLSGEAEVYLGPTKNHFQATEALHPDFEKEALLILRTRYSTEYELIIGQHQGDAEKTLRDLRHNHRAEFRLIMDEKIHTRALADVDAVTPYKLPRTSWYGRMQQRRARTVADRKYAEAKGAVFDVSVASPADIKLWTDAYAASLMNQVGIYPDYNGGESSAQSVDKEALMLRDEKIRAELVRLSNEKFLSDHGYEFAPNKTEEDSRLWDEIYRIALADAAAAFPHPNPGETLKERIEEKAKLLTDGQLSDIKLKSHLAELTEADRVQFTANLYAENIIAAYRDIVPNIVDAEAQKAFMAANGGTPYNPVTATKAEKKELRKHYAEAALSTVQPGRFQWRRQKLVNRTSRTRTRFWRTLDSFFPIEHHKTGLTSAVMRNVPGLYDFWIGNLRTYRAAITMGTSVYWFNYLVWGVSLPVPIWILAMLTRFTVVSPAQWLTRFFRMQGLQAMGGVKDMAFYAFLYSWASFWGTFPTLLFADDFKQLIEGLQKQFGAGVGVVSDQAVAAVETCSKLIGDVRN